MNRRFSSPTPSWTKPIGIGAAIVLVISSGTALTLYLTRQPRVSPPTGSSNPSAVQQDSSGAGAMAAQSGQQIQSATVTATPQITLQGNTRQFRGLGFQFSVSLKDIQGNNLPMSVSGNTVTIGTFQGVTYYAQIFSKNPQDSLEAALTRQFLQGYSSSECNIRVATDVTAEGYPSSFEKAQIYPTGDPEKCPGSYTTFDEQRFFLMDAKHPDKYVFVSGGQAPIDQVVNGKNWEQTISFY